MGGIVGVSVGGVSIVGVSIVGVRADDASEPRDAATAGRMQMIRGPLLPQARAGVWATLAEQLGRIERGLELLLEGVDCSSGQFGLVEGLARDAMGAPVLLLVAVDGDGLLPARAHAACEFLARVGASLPAAVPEASLVSGVPGRVLVIGTDSGAGSLDLLCRLPLPGLEVCRVETFRIAGTDRLTVRWLDVEGAASRAMVGGGVACARDFEVPASCRPVWNELQALCDRIDPGIAWSGDRFSRRVTWHGRVLAHLVVADGGLWGLDPDGVAAGGAARHPLRAMEDVRRWLDGVLRRYARLAGLAGPRSIATAADEPVARASCSQADMAAAPAPRQEESLRTTLSTTRLSAEEYTALGGPTAVRGAESEPGNIADDVARIVTAKGGPRTPPRRTD